MLPASSWCGLRTPATASTILWINAQGWALAKMPGAPLSPSMGQAMSRGQADRAHHSTGAWVEQGKPMEDRVTGRRDSQRARGGGYPRRHLGRAAGEGLRSLCGSDWAACAEATAGSRQGDSRLSRLPDECTLSTRAGLFTKGGVTR